MDFASSAPATADGHGPSRFMSRYRNNRPSVSARKSGGKDRHATRVGDLKSKSEILKKRSVKQAQARRRKMKRKAAAVKGQSVRRRKGQMK